MIQLKSISAYRLRLVLLVTLVPGLGMPVQMRRAGAQEATATPTPTFTATAPAPPITPVGQLTVEPASGPVGTVVRIRGASFDMAPLVALTFECTDRSGATAKPAGYATVFQVTDQSEPRTSFDITWEIPPVLSAQQGQGGGPTPLGSCRFLTRPPGNAANFTVTSRAVTGLPGTGNGPASSVDPWQGVTAVAAIVFAAILLLGLSDRLRRPRS